LVGGDTTPGERRVTLKKKEKLCRDLGPHQKLMLIVKKDRSKLHPRTWERGKEANPREQEKGDVGARCTKRLRTTGKYFCLWGQMREGFLDKFIKKRYSTLGRQILKVGAALGVAIA